jgi:uncharacterized protein YaaR (DUF327 family)
MKKKVYKYILYRRDSYAIRIPELINKQNYKFKITRCDEHLMKYKEEYFRFLSNVIHMCIYLYKNKFPFAINQYQNHYPKLKKCTL